MSRYNQFAGMLAVVMWLNVVSGLHAHIVDGGDADKPPIITPDTPAESKPSAPSTPDAPANPGGPVGSPSTPTQPASPQPSAPTNGDQPAPGPQPPNTSSPQSPANGERPALPLPAEVPVQMTNDGLQTQAMSLSSVSQIQDSAARVRELSATFGQILSSLDPDLRLADGSRPSPYKVVEVNRDRLSAPEALQRAYDVIARMELAAAERLPAGITAPTADEIKMAEQAFQQGIEDIRSHVPQEVAGKLLASAWGNWWWWTIAAIFAVFGAYAASARRLFNSLGG